MNSKTIVIAEAGVNHNGCLATAKELVRVAAASGADYVKFQTFTARNLASKYAEQAVYQIKNTKKKETQIEMLERLELQREWHGELIELSSSEGIKFLTTAFDIESTNFIKQLDLGLFKVPSGEITNLPYLTLVGSYNQPIIISTGMANLGEIEAALSVIEASGTSRDKITLLHCTTEYPAPFNEVNLTAMLTLRDCFKVAVGYSDHTVGISIPIAAVTLGASIIEKHFTLNRELPGPDHKASIEPKEFDAMVRSIREVEMAMGTGIKKPTSAEIKNISIARKSIVAKIDIAKGETFSADNLDCKRPGNGISPMRLDYVIGRTATRSFFKDELIET